MTTRQVVALVPATLFVGAGIVATRRDSPPRLGAASCLGFCRRFLFARHLAANCYQLVFLYQLASSSSSLPLLLLPFDGCRCRLVALLTLLSSLEHATSVQTNELRQPIAAYRNNLVKLNKLNKSNRLLWALVVLCLIDFSVGAKSNSSSRRPLVALLISLFLCLSFALLPCQLKKVRLSLFSSRSLRVQLAAVSWSSAQRSLVGCACAR